MTEEATYEFYVDWDNDGYFDGAGEDCTADFVSAVISRGFSDSLARVARVGRLTVVLNNLERQYSPPLDGDVHPRREVLLQMTYDALTVVKFSGWIDGIVPSSGLYEDRRVVVECVDAMALLDGEEGELALATNVYADELIGDAVDAVYSPAAVDYDPGVNLFPVSADRWAWETPGQAVEEIKASQKIGDACLSDWGNFYIARDGTPTFRNRNYMPLDPTTVLTLAGTMQELTASITVRQVYNFVEVVCHPRDVGTVLEVLAAIAQRDAPVIGAGQSVTYVMSFRDSSNTNIKVGGKDCLTPVATTDYECTADPGGEGADVTGSVSCVGTFYGDHAEVTLTNGSGSAVYLQRLQVRGYAVRTRESITVAAQDAGSIATYQRRKLRLDAALMDAQSAAQAMADYLLGRYSEARLVLGSVGIVANVDATTMEAVRDLELCQRIELSEGQTGLSNWTGYVWGLTETIEGVTHRVDLGLVEAFDLGGIPFRIGDALNSGHILIY